MVIFMVSPPPNISKDDLWDMVCFNGNGYLYTKRLLTEDGLQSIDCFIPYSYDSDVSGSETVAVDIVLPNLEKKYSNENIGILLKEKSRLLKQLNISTNTGVGSNEQGVIILSQINIIQKKIDILYKKYLIEYHKDILKKYADDLQLIENSIKIMIAAFGYNVRVKFENIISHTERSLELHSKSNLPHIKRFLLTTDEYNLHLLKKLLLEGGNEKYTGIGVYLDYLCDKDKEMYDFILKFMDETISTAIEEFSDHINNLKDKMKDISLTSLNQEISLPQVIYPDNFYRAKDKVTNSVYENKLTIGQFKPVITGNKGKNDFGALVKIDSNLTALELNNDGMGGHTIAFFYPLDEEARIIFDVVANLYYSGNKIITPKDILKVKRNNKKAQMSASTEQDIIKIVDSLARRQVVILSNDNTAPLLWGKVKFKPEKKYYNKLADKMEGALLPVEKFSTPYIDVDGIIKEKDVYWKILKMPVLYEYAQIKGQISATPMKYLEPTKRGKENFTKRSGHSDSLRIFLATEIDTMNKNPKGYSNIITCERLYKVGGVLESDSENTRKRKCLRIRKLTESTLDLMLKNGAENFTGYKWHKKLVGRAQTYHSIEILLTDKKKIPK